MIIDCQRQLSETNCQNLRHLRLGQKAIEVHVQRKKIEPFKRILRVLEKDTT